jgi:hypothetical protein
VNRLFCLLLLGLLPASSLSAQMIVRPAPPLDSGQIVIRDALWALRDSLVTIDGSAARLQRDYRDASGPALLARARFMSQACARSSRAIPPARSVVLAADLPDKSKLHRRRLLGELDSLSRALSACQAEFAAMGRAGQAERVRGYGNDRAQRVQNALRSYDRAVQGFLRVMKIPYVPSGMDLPTASG